MTSERSKFGSVRDVISIGGAISIGDTEEN